MRSSSSDAAATLKHDLSEPPSVLEYRTPEGCPQSVSDPFPYGIRPGVLRYNGSDNHRINFTTSLPASQALTEYQVKCDYCGEEPQPSLDIIGWARGLETVPRFCCAQWQRLCQILVKQRCEIEERCDRRFDCRTGTPTSNKTRQRDKPATQIDELFFIDKKMEDLNKFAMELQRHSSDLRIYKEYSIQRPGADPSVPTSSKVYRFPLPLEGEWTVLPCNATEQHSEIKEEEETVLVPFCDHNPLSFGICRHQDGAEVLQKYYSNGMTFLTVLPDGSAQAFYPSGLLAVLVVVTKENGRVCIVYDDICVSAQPMRALFQSDGSATCCHSNGSIWLNLTRSGGQCLDEAGARVRRWSWSSRGIPPAPLHPIYRALNKTVGVRVFGKERVLVTFLARGQQAKFNVGACCSCQDECKTVGPASGAAVLEKDLKASRIRIRQLIQHLHQLLKMPSSLRLANQLLTCNCPEASGGQR